MRIHFLCQEYHADDVGLECFPQILFGDFEEILPRVLYTCVIHEYIDRAELIADLPDHIPPHFSLLYVPAVQQASDVFLFGEFFYITGVFFFLFKV